MQPGRRKKNGQNQMNPNPAATAILILGFLAAMPRGAEAATRNAAVLDAVSAWEVAAAMGEFGYEVELETDNQGDPFLVSRVNDSTFTIGFYGCNKNPDVYKRICSDAQYRASYNHSEGASLSLINSWNRDYRFGKAYVDSEGQPTVEMMLNLEGGFTKSYLRVFLKWWALVLRDFEKHIGWREI